jgi:hypothetical protein
VQSPEEKALEPLLGVEGRHDGDPIPRIRKNAMVSLVSGMEDGRRRRQNVRFDLCQLFRLGVT